MIRYLWVNARLLLRKIVWYLTGKRWLVPQIVDVQKLLPVITRRIVDQQLFLKEREKDNRSLLTGMVVALTTKTVPPFTGWEWYKQAAQKQSGFRKGIPWRLVGRPVVYETKNTKIGETEWAEAYVPRQEVLAARKRAKQLAQENRQVQP